MEQVAKNIDRLVTVAAGMGYHPDRWIVPALYEGAAEKLGGKPISLVATQRIIEQVKEGNSVVLVDQFGYLPNMPYGETDGPLGVASLARAVRFGLKALPVLVTGPKDINVARQTTQAAGLNVLQYGEAKEIKTACAGEITFPVVDEGESAKVAAKILDECTPKAVISVETIGPNKKGVKHSFSGFDAGAKDKLPGLEHLFYEASARGILTIGVIDRGNELGSGTIEETVREITPYADVCQCPCKAGSACAVKTDIVFPASISNWGAYAISAMMGYLLKKPEILQNEETEWRMLDASIKAGAIDGIVAQPVMCVDGLGVKAHQGLITLLHTIVKNALSGT
ncbi:MAG: hypothetical protein CL874_03910 [Dehalococcoidales bacterium]|jgi:hypothetical protein|nr:hypothetical protein [Dehalococcoidales bacterium]MDP6448911.1 DUF4392 domain-containing protein [Dehalococcoidales bacterium]MDP6825275.1 DUF4392 domain-containing protein [Dehalococcoidales bacterium]